MTDDEYEPGDRVEFTIDGALGRIVSGPYTDWPWGSEGEPTYLVMGDNGRDGYRSPKVLRAVGRESS